MGHSEYFEFVDQRVGEYGLAYRAASQAEIMVLAERVGYLGPFKHVVKAYPPAPSAEVLKMRALREQLDGCDEIPW